MPKDKRKMLRENDDKPQLSFLLDFPEAMTAFSKVLQLGAEKYARHNWKAGGPITELEDSMLRHILAFHNCEDDDPEFKTHHMAHVICNAAMIIEHMNTHGGEFDDRDWENAE